jgi:hypothetical protein
MTVAIQVKFGSGRYSVATMPGVAFYLTGWATEMREVEVLLCEDDAEPQDHEHDVTCCYVEVEEVESDSMVKAVMVGDDRVHLVDVGDLIIISEDDYCHGCGQIGCACS